MNDRPTYIASCSFGKDSLATILLALEHNEPLDRAVFCEVMFDHERGISGELPEHIEWVHNVAIPKLESWGVKVDVVRAERDYIYYFRNAVRGGGEIQRQTLRFPYWWQVRDTARL
jgi:3'-phosphoadenosine 5'-phosphosulfate sulfotransferase (PAPS reductase)/FAD synthetase